MRFRPPTLLLALTVALPIAATARQAAAQTAAPTTVGAADPSAVALPRLPSPSVSDNARASEFLAAAQGALAAGRLGEAQQALEMAQTRLLDRSVPLGQTNSVSDSPAVREITLALRALSAGEREASMGHIQAAMRAASSDGN